MLIQFDKAHNQLATVKHIGELVALTAELCNELMHMNNCHVMMLCAFVYLSRLLFHAVTILSSFRHFTFDVPLIGQQKLL